MPISAIVVLNSQEPLVESALAAREHRAPRFELKEARLPSGLVIDPTFSAVPMDKSPRGVMQATVAPKSSPSFAVRVFVDAKDPANAPETVDGLLLYGDPVISPFVTCGNDPPVGNANDVETHLKKAALAAGGLDGSGVAIAIVDTGINIAHLQGKLGRVPRFDAANSWSPPGVTAAPGTHAVDHGSMCAYDVLIMAPNATLLDYPILSVPLTGGSVASGTVATAIRAFADLIANWAVAYAIGGAQKYSALVVNNSWGVYHPDYDFPVGHRGRYIDNPNHPFHIQVAGLATAGADIIFAAGNCGAQCPVMYCKGRTAGTIMGANAYGEVLTVAGCDMSDARVGYSSQGPSITNMPQQKPDLTAYTHFLGSEALGRRKADSGTSAACPVAAGCVAALRTKESPSSTPPANLFSQLRTTARKVAGQTGWNGDYGHGIIDPVAAAQSMGLLTGT